MAISPRRPPPLANPKQSRARSRIPSRLSPQVASRASNSGRVVVIFLGGRSPRLTAGPAAQLSTVRIAGRSLGLAAYSSLRAADSTANRCGSAGKANDPSVAFRTVAHCMPANPVAQGTVVVRQICRARTPDTTGGRFQAERTGHLSRDST